MHYRILTFFVLALFLTGCPPCESKKQEPAFHLFVQNGIAKQVDSLYALNGMERIPLKKYPSSAGASFDIYLDPSSAYSTFILTQNINLIDTIIYSHELNVQFEREDCGFNGSFSDITVFHSTLPPICFDGKAHIQLP